MSTETEFPKRGGMQTIFSPCRAYRYALWREWIGGDGYVMFIGLNPSTADETNDDPMIRRSGVALLLRKRGDFLRSAWQIYSLSEPLIQR
jgi:hypothetical protein